MLRFQKYIAMLALSSTLIHLSEAIYAASLDDAMNYKPLLTQNESSNASPYTVEEIIEKIPDILNNAGVFENGWLDLSDPKIIAFNKVNFENCEELYIKGEFDHNRGTIIIRSVLRFSFSENEKMKDHASSTLKSNINYIENELSRQRRKSCSDNLPAKISKIKELANAIIQSAPSILVENQKRVEAARAIEDEKKRRDLVENQKRVEAARAIEDEKKRREEASNKTAAEKRKRVREQIESKNLAIDQGIKEQDARVKACKETNKYKLHETSNAIVRYRSMESNAQQAINNQKEASEISGIVDKKVMYDAGNLMVAVRELSAENFISYRKMGGSARSIELVTPSQDPCKEPQ